MQVKFEQASLLLGKGEAAKSEQILREILQDKPKNEDSLALLGHSLMTQGKLDDAVIVFKKIIKHYPKSANAFVELASAMLSKKNKEKAEQYFQRAVELDPGYSTAWHFLGNLLMERGSRKKAKDCFIKSEKHDPFAIHIAEVQRLLKQKEFHQAERNCREILKHHSNHPRALHTIALLAEQTEDYEQAIKILQHGLKYSPYHVTLWQRLVINNACLGFFEQAIKAARYLVQLEPYNGLYIMLLASELANTGQNIESLKYYDRAAELLPKEANVFLQRGHILKSLGQREACEASYRKSFSLEYNNGAAFWALADLKSYKFEDSDIIHMQSLLNDPKASAEQATQAAFALAKHYEDNNDYEKAYSTYQDANNRKSASKFSPQEYQDSCARVQASFPVDTLKVQARAIQSEATPIFIVGLTRSGSTLIEQILASHSSIEGTRELYSLPRVVRLTGIQGGNKPSAYPECIDKLNPEQLAKLGEHYLKETAIFRTNKPYFTDKMPPNFHNVGLIHKILPNAKIIDARRHPLSAGFSNFKQHFARGFEFSYDLKNIGQYYNTYLKLMDYWDSVLPSKVYCVQYEEMVNDTETQIRQLIDHCGLSFEEQCLQFFDNKRSVHTASSEQVRQPIYQKGMQQWRHFEQWLEPLKESLGEETLKRFSTWS